MYGSIAGSGQHCCFYIILQKKIKSASVHRYIIILCAASSKKIQKNFKGSEAKKIPIRRSRRRKQVSCPETKRPLKRGEVVQAVVVVFGVVGLIGVDDEQSRSPEMSSLACSSEIKEDSLRFVLRPGDHIIFGHGRAISSKMKTSFREE